MVNDGDGGIPIMSDATIDERLAALEAKLLEKDAQILGLAETCALLVTSNALMNDDKRIISELSSRAKEYIEKCRNGGMPHVPPNFFCARGEILVEVLQCSGSDNFTSSHWKRSPFSWLDERGYQKIKHFEEAVMSAINRAQS